MASRGGSGGRNPFAVPSDEEMLAPRSSGRAEGRGRADRGPLSQSCSLSRTGASPLSRRALDLDPVITADMSFTLRTNSPLATRFPALAASPDPRPKGTLSGFIAKKRETGLTRIALANKRREMERLEEEAVAAERRVRQQEDQLEATVRQFEQFLRDNEARAAEAARRADAEAKERQERAAEVKRLGLQAAAAAADRAKTEEQLQACLRYRRFLDQLTPSAWLQEALAADHGRRCREELGRQLEGRLGALADPQDPVALAAARTAGMADIDRRVAEAVETAAADLSALDDAALQEEAAGCDPDRLPMYFTAPEQLLQAFAEIEENNLFLVRNCQETEETLEDLRSRFAEAKQRLDEEGVRLRGRTEALRTRSTVEEERRRSLQQRVAAAHETQHAEDLLAAVHARTAEIFKASGLGDNDAHMSALAMLTKIEARLEEAKARVAALPPEFVAGAMKQRDKDRRLRQRQRLLDDQRAQREERSRKALARTQAPAQRSCGRPVMWRSRPLDRTVAAGAAALEAADEGDAEFFT